MRQQKYMNVMLTVNAVLLAVLAWTQLAETPVLATSAEAQVVRERDTRNKDVVNARFPNSTQQRAEMLRALAEIRQAVQSNADLLTSGAVKVEVTNLSELLIDNR